MRTDAETCPACQGDGGLERLAGYRITGWGFGDAEEIEERVKCERCDGRGEIKHRAPEEGGGE